MEGGQLAVLRTSAVCRAPASCAARLSYSPPTHYSTGVAGHITDPFEDNTVRARAGNERPRSFIEPGEGGLLLGYLPCVSACLA